MGIVGSFLNGIAQGAIYVALALYGQAIGLATGAIGALIGCATLGGMLLQFPLGRLSDRIDRRLVIVAAAGLAVPVCLALAAAARPASDTLLLYAGVAVVGGLTLPIYSICVAHANDDLKPGQIVAASGTLVLVLGAGIVVGPTLGALAIELAGASGLFLLLAVIQGGTAAIALFRLWRGRSRPASPGAAVAIAHGVTPGAARLNPEAPRQD
jgi:MFS family permease